MTNTIHNVPRELLERASAALKGRMCGNCRDESCCSPDVRSSATNLRALLSDPSPAGVDGCRCSMSISMLGDGCRYCQPQEYIDRLSEMLDEERAELSDAQATSDGLRGENERIRRNIAEYNEAIACYQSERDQQAQRIGELEGLLQDSAELIKHGVFEDGICCCGSSVDSHGFGDGHSPVDALAYHAGQVCERIDAALSAGKEGE